LVHGDFKTGNLFFGPDEEVTAIDFQWSGMGVGATDIVYLIGTGSSDALLEGIEVDKDVLEPYYSAFLAAAKRAEETGAVIGATYTHATFAQLQDDFQLALLDYVRWIMACRLPGSTPASFAKCKAEMNLNLGAYRRSEPLVKWLFSKVAEYLPLVEKRFGIPK
jgi:hypothetical protein